MATYRRYDDVAVGDVFPPEPLLFRVTPEVVTPYLEAIGDKSATECASERPVPSMMAAVYLIELLAARRAPPGGIHAKQSMRFHRAARMGETLSIQATVVEKYLRKDRPYVVSAFEARGQHGELVSTGRITTIWGREQ